MAILNFTTKVDAWKTVNEITLILSKHGVTNVNIKNEGSRPVAVSFSMNYHTQPLNFLLPCNHEGVWRAIKNNTKIEKRYRNEDQAFRTSWRIIKDWVEAQMAIVEAELSTVEEVFLPYLILNASGETLANRMLKGDGIKLLNC